MVTHWPATKVYVYLQPKTNEISFNTHLLVIAYFVHTYCVTFVISSLVHNVRPDDGLIENKGPKHDVYLLTPYTLIKFCCVLTYPPYHCDTVIAHNRDEPPKERDSAFDSF